MEYKQRLATGHEDWWGHGTVSDPEGVALDFGGMVCMYEACIQGL